MVLHKRYIYIFSLLLLLFIVLSLVYTGISIKNGYNVHSDAASIILETQDILEGNILLSGWNLSTVSFYTTDILLYILMSIFFGPTSKLLYVVPAIIYAAIVVLSMFITYRFNNDYKVMKTFLVFILLGIPSTNVMSFFLNGPIHMGTIFLLLLSFLILQYIDILIDRRNIILFIIYFSTLSFAIIGDDFGIYFGALPIIISCILSLIRKRNVKNKLIILIITLISITFSKLLLYIIEITGGFIIPGETSATFLDYSLIFTNIMFSIEQLLYLFDANFFGQEIFSITTLSSILRCLILVIFIISTIYTIKNYINESLLTQVLVLSIILNYCAYTFSGYMTGDLHLVRYLLPFYIFGSILIININKIKLLRRKSIFYILFCIFLIFAISSISKIPHTSYTSAENKFDHLSNFLEQKGLYNGFGEYWASNIVTLESENEIKIRAVIPIENSLFSFNWLSKEEWYKEGANFFVIDSANNRYDDYIKATYNTFGSPSETYEHNGFTVLIWDKNIAPLLANADNNKESSELKLYKPYEDIFNMEITASFVSGWYHLEGTENSNRRWTDKESILNFYSNKDINSNLSFNILSYNKNNTAHIYLNDIEIYSGEISTNIQKLNLKAYLLKGENTMKIISSDTDNPSKIDLNSDDDRELSFNISSISIE